VPPTPPPSTFELAQALARRKASGHLRVRVPNGSAELTFLSGRLVWARSDDPAMALAPALVGSGLISTEDLARLDADMPTEDDLVLAAAELANRNALDAVRREVVRARIRLALAEGEDGRFTEIDADLAGFDPALLPDLDLAGLGQEARRSDAAKTRSLEEALTTAPALAPALAPAAKALLDRFQARHTDSWYDLLGERLSASPASLRRAAASRREEWGAVAEHAAADETVRWRAQTLLAVVDLAAERLEDPQKRQAYDQLLERGGAPMVADLVAEIEPSAEVDFAPAADTPDSVLQDSALQGSALQGSVLEDSVMQADITAGGPDGADGAPATKGKKGLFARLFGGGR
jgi:hypothetical protein